MNKKGLTFLVVVFLVFVGLAYWVWRSERPARSQNSPLASVAKDQISQLKVSFDGATVVARPVGGEWRLAEPVDDLADRSAVESLLDALKEFKLGSVLSENAARHEQYQVNEASATRIQAFIKGNEAPVLDLLVGKSAADIESSYVRAPGSAGVRTAEGLSRYLLPSSAEAWRSRTLLPFDFSDATAIVARAAKLDLEIEKSTDTWTRKKTGERLDGALVAPVGASLRSAGILRFEVVSSTESYGFDKPELVVEVRSPGKSVTLTFGRAFGPKDDRSRYAKSSERSAVLVLSDRDVSELVSRLKKIP